MGGLRTTAGANGRSASLRLGRILLGGASLIVLSGIAAAPAMAQDAPQSAPADQTGSTDIVVTGIRASLANSQEIKRNADTVVDAITATDIGALPDRSVTEALQRVPGVSMNRFAGSNDPDHFSVEGSGVVIRGLSFVRSEFNGRDTFSTGVYGQAINFSDVPSELLGSVEVYKNATADMIEGGLSGTVNLNTRVPLDNPGFHLSYDVEMNYGDLSKKWAPTDSILISNTWNTGIGTIGLLGDFSYSDLKSRADGIQVTNFQTRDNTLVGNSDNSAQICRNPLPSDDDTTTLPPAQSACGLAEAAGADGFADPRAVSYAPLGGQFRTQDYDHKRSGIALAGQWESLDRRAKLTAQYLRTDSTSSWGEHTFESAPDLSEYNTYPAGCEQNDSGPLTSANNTTTRAQCPVGNFQNYQYDDDGVFEKGFITLPGTGWRTADSGTATTTVPTGGIQQSLSRRQVRDENVVSDYGLNFKFKPNDHWDFNVDGQYVKATHDTLDVSIFGSTFADEELDLTGNIPAVNPHKPLTLAASWASPNPVQAAETDSEYFHDPMNEFWRAAMDHIEHSKGQEWAFKGDVAYNFDDDDLFLKQIKVGARYADRDQDVRYTTYNWGVLSEIWSGNGGAVSMAQAGGDRTSFYDFDNFFRGDTPGPVGGYYYNGNLIGNYDQFGQFATGIHDIWNTQNNANNTSGWVPAADRPNVVAGTPFLPGEIQSVSERNVEAYLMLRFGNDRPLFGGVRLNGNIGVRYVDTRLDSGGAFGIPTADQLGVTQDYATRCASSPPPPQNPSGSPSGPGGICNIGPTNYAKLQAFAGDGSTTPVDSGRNYQYFLPSVNLKFGLTRDLILRFAASRALARPVLADVRNYFRASFDNASNTLTTSVGNPELKPALSDQFDLTLEWYFARVGSLTIDGFYKNIHDFFYQGVIPVQLTNNGITQTFNSRGPLNYDGSGKVKGFEVAYQQTLDFLPGILSGLGINANYTYIESSGLPNTFVQTDPAAPVHNSPNGATFKLPLEQLSKHNVNVQVFYEKGPISLRAAYNWRSRFLLTAADVIFPYTPIFNAATGQLDASAFYSINKHIKIGVQAVNLTNEVTKTEQMFTQSGLLGPRSYFINDRRFSFIMRANF